MTSTPEEPTSRRSPSYTDYERREVARRAAARLQEQLDTWAEAAREVERETGVRILHPDPAHTNLLTATIAGLEDLEHRAKHILEGMTLVRQLLPRGDQRPLGTALKVATEEQAQLIRHHFKVAGFELDGGTP